MANKLQVKISLRGAKPPIWRTLWIRDNITFQEFHQIIQAAMGWCDCHLYQFDLTGVNIGIPYEDSFEDITNAAKTKLNKYLSSEGDKCLYTYDFGDSWEHLIVIEKVEPISKVEKYPICIKGKGNCPPEDCGGIWGYYELLETIKDEKHPDHEDILEWLDGDFDPNEFDLAEINQQLKIYQ